jgi:large subunit ribosomal protein L10
LQVVKNTLLKKALEKSEKDASELYSVLAENTSIMFSEVGNVPAKLIKKFRKDHKKPVLKAAYVEESCYIGEDQLDNLVNIKSKEELIADIIALLQSPIKNVVSSLQSGGQTLVGVLETLSNKE